jgi:hypothetical protein
LRCTAYPPPPFCVSAHSTGVAGMRRRGRQAMHFGSTLCRKRKRMGHPENRHPAFETRIRSSLASPNRANAGEILRLRVPAGNREGTISGRKRSRDATLRMTTGGIGRHFGAGFSANIGDVIRVVNINQGLFTYRFIRINFLRIGNSIPAFER